VLYPAFVYGAAYRTGPSVRAGIHGSIAENDRRRERREARAIAARRERNQKNELN